MFFCEWFKNPWYAMFIIPIETKIQCRIGRQSHPEQAEDQKLKTAHEENEEDMKE